MTRWNRVKWAFTVVTVLVLTGITFSQEKQPQPTHRDVKYGPHARNVLDFWQARPAESKQRH